MSNIANLLDKEVMMIYPQPFISANSNLSPYINEYGFSPAIKFSLQSEASDKQLDFYEKNQIEVVEDIADDSDEEKSIKDQNMHQIKSLEAGRGPQVFSKNFSEHDFLHKEFMKKGKNLISGQQPSNKIQLIVRIRPFLVTEQIKECLKVVNDNGIRLFKEFHQIHFKFDNILMPKDSQENVFSKVQNIVQGFLMGINGTIFAYGQTGAGKTYSITGGEQRNEDLKSNQKRGILPRTIDMVFNKLLNESQANKQSKINLYVSFYEIYNEKIYDLLTDIKVKQTLSNNQQKRSLSRGSQQNKEQAKPLQPHLEIREEKDGQFSIPELKKIHIQSLQEAYEQLDKGLQRRATSSTSLNNQSSRSHSVFQIFMEKINPDGHHLKSKIRIVDLAGSEKYTIKKDLPATEKNMKVQELTSINSSLSALGQCISALSDPQRKHIPYRNSKLTKILKDSLDENSNLALIICISPSVDSYKETLSTLQFADRAKKAILDGRNFSDSKLLQEQNQNSESLVTILKAYQEEKAIRKELENYMKENNNVVVLEELNRLKKQNQELQDKVKQLEQTKSQSDEKLTESNLNEKQNSNKKSIGKMPKSCLKQENSSIQLGQSQQLISINIVRILDSNLGNNQEEEDDPNRKRVRFAEKLDNDQSLDSDDRERIEHNLKYNDDTIFDGISIFQDLNNSGMVAHRLKDRKDVHPSKLKQPLPIDEDDEEEEEEKKEPIKIDQQAQIPQQQQELNQNSQQVQLENNESLSISQINDPQVKSFWGVESVKKQKVFQHSEYDINKDSGVSPIQKKKPNNSSQDMSKDLLDLENEGEAKNLDAFEESKISQDHNDCNQISQSQRSTFKNFDFITGAQNDYNQSMFEANDLFNDQDRQTLGNNFFTEDGNNTFFDQQYNENNQIQKPQEDIILEDMDQENNNQQISDSMIGLDAALETDNIPSMQNINNSQDNQNTLLLDSQSMIIDDPIKDQNLSQQMFQQIDASSIMNQRDLNQDLINIQGSAQQHCFFSAGNNALLGQMQILQGGMSSNGNSSNVNTDVLTYSLTNTFSTIESLHEELTAIRNGLEQSQKRGTNLLKTIHQYAREIEEQKVIDYFEHKEELKQQQMYQSNKKQNQKEDTNMMLQNSSQKKNVDIYDEDNFNIDIDNINFVRDIKGFYSKIHQEIHQLKTILIDNASQNQNVNNSPYSHQKLEKDLARQLQTQQDLAIDLRTPTQYNSRNRLDGNLLTNNTDLSENNLITQSSAISIEGIEKTQEIVSELRKEMELILNINQNPSSYKRKRNEKNKTQKSLKVLDLLEALQTSLAQAITPNKSTSQLLKLSNDKVNTQNKHDSQNTQMHVNQKHKTQDTQMNISQSFQNELIGQGSSIEKIENDAEIPLFIENMHDISKVVAHQVDLSQIAIDNQHFNLQSIIETKNLIQYEEMPSESVSPPSIKHNQIESSHMPSRQESRQRTPEIFKSLAKLDESDAGFNIDKDVVFSNSNHNQNQQLFNNPITITQINNFFSQNSSNAIQNQYGQNSDNPDFQITLRSYNVNNDLNTSNLNNLSQVQNHGHQHHQQYYPQDLLKTQTSNKLQQSLQQIQAPQNTIIQQNLNSSDFDQNPLIINNLNAIDRKKSIIGSKIENMQLGTDNTLTLIFDSDEEQQFDGDENDDKFGGEPIIQEVDEDEQQSQRSLIFNGDDDSKIEQNSSQGNNSRIVGNLITSNSFQGDNSLLIFANNFVNNAQDNLINNYGEQFDQSNSILLKKSNNSLSKSRDEMLQEKQDPNDKSNLDPTKRQNKKYLLPLQTRQDSERLISNLQPVQPVFTQHQLNIMQQKSQKDIDESTIGKICEVDVSNEESKAAINQINQDVMNKSTSKTSVQKYWNQFFNNKQDIISQTDNLTQKSPISQQNMQSSQAYYGINSNLRQSNQAMKQLSVINQSSTSMNMSTSMDQIPSEQNPNSKYLLLMNPPPSSIMRNIVQPQTNQHHPYSHSTAQFNSLHKTKEQMHQPSQSFGGLPSQQLINPQISMPIQLSNISQGKNSKQGLAANAINKLPQMNSFSNKRNSGVEVNSTQSKSQNQQQSMDEQQTDNSVKIKAASGQSTNHKSNNHAKQTSILNKRKFSHGNHRL
eukprot:403344143